MRASYRLIALTIAVASVLSITLFASNAASQERRDRPSRDVPASIQLTPDPLTIDCDGVDSSSITVRVTDARGRAVPNGTVVHFDARFGFTDPVEAQTRRGEASTEVRFYPVALQFPGETGVDVTVGDLRAFIGVDCNQPVPCNPFSPPAHPMSPPCAPLPCSTTDSPPIGQSPPCPPQACDVPFSPPCNLYEMRLDTDPFISGVQDFATHPVGATFGLSVQATSVGDEPYAGYRWMIEWPSAALDFGGVVFEQGPFLGLESCAAGPRAPVIDPAYDSAFGGGCASEFGASTSFVGQLTQLQMTCIAPGYFAVQLIGKNVTDGFASTFVALSEGEFPTSTYHAFVLCEEPPCGPTASPPCATPAPGCEHPMSPPCGTPTPTPNAPITLALDADITNGSGPCTQIDDVTSMSVGDTRQVGVCLLNPSGTVPIAAFGYRIAYDDRIVVAPEVANLGTGLDDNPDANTGATTFTSPLYPNSLGGGWDCSASIGIYPVGDTDGTPQDGDGTAYSGGCGSPAGPNTLIQGPLSVITFQALAAGTTTLRPFQVAVTRDDLLELGSCEPLVEIPMTCLDATIVVTGDAPPTTSTPTPMITPPATSTPTAAITLPTPITAARRMRRVVD